MTEKQAINIINLVLVYIEKYCLDSVKDQILKNKKILFNQKGAFISYEELFIDVDIEEAYKNIFEKYKYDIRNILLHKEIQSKML